MVALPILPRRDAITDAKGQPTLPFQVWWQVVTRRFDELAASVSRAVPFRAVTGSGPALVGDFLLLVDATAAAVTISLPAAETARGAVIVTKKTDASANTVTLDPNGSETIDGASTRVITAQYDALTVACDGNQWWVV